MSSASATALFSITVQRCMRDNRPVAMGSASAAAYRCSSNRMAQVYVGYSCSYSCPGVLVGQVVYYILHTPPLAALKTKIPL